jgi:hypothetical protein
LAGMLHLRSIPRLVAAVGRGASDRKYSTRAFVEELLPFVVPVLVTAAFQLAFRCAPPHRVWPVALVAIVLVTVAAIWFDQHGFTSKSPMAFAPMLVVPGIVSGLVAHLGRGRWPWPVTTVVASLATFCSIVPMWIFGCILASRFALGPGCRF